MPDLALADGGRLAYELTGTGRPLLLCRWSVGSMALWRSFAQRLAHGHQVIAFDPRGTGGSSDVPLDSTTRDCAHDALALLDALGVRRADVFGESLGGMTASWLAADAPLRVRHLILASALPSPLTISPHAILGALPVARALVRPTPQAISTLVCAFAKTCALDWRRALEDDLRRAPMRRKNLLAIGLASLRHHAPRVHVPTLQLFGADDPLIDASVRDRADVIADAGHVLTLERPREVAARVLDFIAEEVPCALP
jgi:3-oxoadipate enol-lactonase